MSAQPKRRHLSSNSLGACSHLFGAVLFSADKLKHLQSYQLVHGFDIGTTKKLRPAFPIKLCRNADLVIATLITNSGQPGMSTGQPTPQSLDFRTNLGRLVSGLRRVHSRSPFFKLAAHRIPTLWSLYRGLLRASPTEHVRRKE